MTPLIFCAIDNAVAPRDLTRSLISLEIDESEEKATKISLELDDPDGALRELLPAGTQIAVRWGWVGNLSAPRGGIVHLSKPSYDGATTLVEAYGRELALSVGKVRRTFRNMTFRAALETVVRDAGLNLRWEARDTVQFDGQVINNETVWAWIQTRCAELGLVSQVDGDVLTVREPPADGPPEIVLAWKWRGSTMTSFEVEEDSKRGENEAEGVVAVFTDPATGATLRHAAGSPGTTRASLAARRLAARNRPTAAEQAAVSAYVAEHPDLADLPPAAQRTAWERARAQQQANGAAPTQDSESFLTVLLDTGEVRPSSAASATANAPGSAANTQDPARAQANVQAAAEGAAGRAHAERIAQGKFRDAERKKIKAKATCDAIPGARRGALVRIVGTQQRDAGAWYVAGLRTKVGDGAVTEFELQRDGVNTGRGGRHARNAAQTNAARNGAAVSAPTTQPTNTRVVDLEREAQ